MAQENIYPFTVAGEDIQRLLPESIGAAFKMVWDAPADSPEVLKQAGEKLFCARGALEKNASNQDAVCDSLRYLQLTRALNLIYRSRTHAILAITSSSKADTLRFTPRVACISLHCYRIGINERAGKPQRKL